jgi:SAM-dependent methyltransferase
LRRAIIDLLRCPRCRRGALIPEAQGADVMFGPLRCPECHASYPVSEGVADLLGEARDPGTIQRGFEQPWVARAYERYLRSVFQIFISRQHFDEQSEFAIYRSLLGPPSGAILDLGCGTGLFARRLAREAPDAPVVGLDVSHAMIEEAVAQSREHGIAVDFIRAEAPELPFRDASLGGILQARGMSFIDDVGRLFAEVSRVLRPGARFVASTHLPPRFGAAAVHRRLGLHPRSEEVIRTAASAAGLTAFERVLLPPFIVVKAAKA